MVLKFHAWIYRTFGVFTSYAERKQDEYLKTLTNPTEFEIMLATGCWQAEHGFYRTWEQVQQDLRRKREKN